MRHYHLPPGRPLRAVATLLLAAALGAAGGCGLAAPRGPRPAVAEQDSARVQRILTQMDSLRRADGIPGLAVAILHDTTLLAARGFGLAEVETRRPVTAETPFNIASVTKPVAAVVALRLVSAGVLDLDRPMRQFADFPEFCAEAHAAGGIFFGDLDCTSQALTLRRVLGMAANGEPGTRFWYNPPLYSWTSRPLAEVGGRSFSDLVDSLVFRPAGMVTAARQHRRLALPAAIAAALAVPYHVDSAGVLRRSVLPPPQGDGAAGGVIASVMDLARFDRALGQGVLLTPEVREALWRPGVTKSGAELPYGLGWFVGRWEDRRVVWHTGLWEGQYSALYFKVLGERPDDRWTLILLANSDALQWPTRFDEAAVQRSPYAAAFMQAVRHQAPQPNDR
jgi:CubicO group peptidase (beta-lactamase class C family)